MNTGNGDLTMNFSIDARWAPPRSPSRWRCPAPCPRSTCASASPRIPTCSIPTLARTYVGRIVFASLCDKLFDIDEKLEIVPQLALGHETSADGKTVTIKLRPGVKFHDGEKFDAEAVKFSPRAPPDLQGSFRRPELAPSPRSRSSIRYTVKLNLKQPFSPLMAQLTDRAGMMVSPKAAEAGRQVRHQAGLRRPVQVRRARAAGPHRGRALRRLLGQGRRSIDASCTSRSPTRPCASPTCSRASST
jgi:hypothetical protein